MSDTDPSTFGTSSFDPTTFDPFSQNVTMYSQSGDPIIIPLNAVAYFAHDGMVQVIIQASQLGAALAVLLILIALTTPEKRRLPAFLLNSLALIFVVIGQILACCYYTSGWYTPYSYFTNDFSFLSPGAEGLAIAAPIVFVLLVVCIEASLVFQVHVVCATLDRPKRLAMMGVSFAVAVVAIAFRVAQTVDNVLFNVVRREYNPASEWLVKARDITLTISILFFSAVFCAKLAWSLRRRRQLGLTQFGPMQIIFIGGAQTLILPAIFAAMQFALPTTRINSMILTTVALSLPLTALWSSAATHHPSTRGHKQFILPASNFSASETVKPRSRRGLLSGLSALTIGKRREKKADDDEKAFGSGGSLTMGTQSTAVGGLGAVEVEKGFGVDGRERDLEMQNLGK